MYRRRWRFKTHITFVFSARSVRITEETDRSQPYKHIYLFVVGEKKLQKKTMLDSIAMSGKSAMHLSNERSLLSSSSPGALFSRNELMNFQKIYFLKNWLFFCLLSVRNQTRQKYVFGFFFKKKIKQIDNNFVWNISHWYRHVIESQFFHHRIRQVMLAMSKVDNNIGHCCSISFNFFLKKKDKEKLPSPRDRTPERGI